jgi:glycosyltransferase involved in cell wall biosynthesis
MSAKISVIIPLYNAREYIKSCVDSILRQTMGDIEILLIDDCSTDGSPEYCLDLYRGERRVRMIRQSVNMGPGEARNRGIKEAGGEYIAFVDSDDQLKEDAFSCMLAAAEETGADVLHVAGILIPTADELPENLSELPRDGITPISFDMEGRSDSLMVLPDDPDKRFDKWRKHCYHWSVWNKLYKRSFIEEHELSFSELRLAEDMQFCMQCLFLAKTYTIIPGAWYFWRVVEGSASRARDQAALLKKALRAEIAAGNAVRGSIKKIPYFAENPARATEAVFYVMRSLELAFIRPCYASLKREDLQNDSELYDIFLQGFGAGADAALYHFLEMLDSVPEGIDYGKVFNGKDAWERFRYEYSY